MPGDHTESEARLRKLADRLHRGWAVQHPATEKDLAAVRQAVREQWEKEQRLEQKTDQGGPAKTPEQEVAQDKTKNVQHGQTRPQKSQDKNHGHSH